MQMDASSGDENDGIVDPLEEILAGIDPVAERGHRISSMQHVMRYHGIPRENALKLYGLDKEPPTEEELVRNPAWTPGLPWEDEEEE
jgi:hypothetical protein